MYCLYKGFDKVCLKNGYFMNLIYRAIHYLIDSGKMNELNNKNEQSSSVSTHRGDRFKNSKLEKKKVGYEHLKFYFFY